MERNVDIVELVKRIETGAPPHGQVQRHLADNGALMLVERQLGRAGQAFMGSNHKSIALKPAQMHWLKDYVLRPGPKRYRTD